ncbi:MAG TPA: ABC transporter ATP-binding protein [Fimbriimonas sp.]|nr:ABC transporter ATP-binding protein [Fimbriimonas sp.]
MIETHRLTKTYSLGPQRIEALRGIDVAIGQGEFVAIMGPSGSGKSTFMNIIGCLDRPTSGDYQLDGEAINGLNDNQLAEVRNSKIGFVFQSFHLLPKMSALQNVEVPLLYAGVRERRARAEAALVAVGLADRIHHKPMELSGGQQQRVAIARALVNDPALILADEPTGNLDSGTSVEILDLFTALREAGKTILMVTHEPEIAARCERIIRFRDGVTADEA